MSDEPGARGRKGRTATYRFGASRREAHDSREFYARFAPPQLDAGEELATEVPRELLVCGDSRTMRELPDRSVALVVTSPPYFVGKEYEAAVGQGSVPASYLDYPGCCGTSSPRRCASSSRGGGSRSTSPTSGASPTGASPRT